MSEQKSEQKSEKQPDRVVVFGATGHLGASVVSRLENLPWSGFEVLGVVSDGSTEIEFEYRGELLDAQTSPPALRKGDLVFVCTPGEVAHELVRAALQAEAPCIDCTGVMAAQTEVAMPVLSTDFHGEGDAGESDAPAHGKTPLLAQPGATAIAWAPLLECLHKLVGIQRVVATVLRSASSRGRLGLVALSEESIALFNQSDIPETGPAGQAVAFDVIPDRLGEGRTADELDRLFDSQFSVDVMSLQVPTFVGEGASLAIELSNPVDESELRKRLEGIAGFSIVDEGVGTRGLAAVEAGKREPSGPTLRDAAGAEEVLVGGLRPDGSLAQGLGWRLWLSYDPVRLAAEQAIRLARLRFPGS